MRKRLPSIRNSTGLIIFLILLNLLLPSMSLSAPKKDTKIEIVYFYMNSCEACHAEEEFAELFNNLVGEEKIGTEVQLLMYNTFHASGASLLEEYYNDYNVPENERAESMIFIGDTYLSGPVEIKNRLWDEFIRAKTVLKGKESGNLESASSPVEYFYVTPCSSCQEIDEFLETIGKVNIDRYNINQKDALDLVKKYFEAYKVPEKEQSVPIIFVGDTYLSGEKNIKKYLVDEINRAHDVRDTTLIDTSAVGGSGGDLSGYNITGVLLTGFVNGLNPCSLSMLLFFLAILVARNVSILKMGFAFIAGKFITYFLLGTLLFNIFIKLDILKFQMVAKVIMVGVLILIAIFNLRDSLAARREDYDKIKMQLPVFLRRKNHQWINKFSNTGGKTFLLPLSFILGVLVSLGEFLCTGQIYLATIVSILHNSKALDYRAIIYFVLYGLSFVSPPILATILVYKGRQIFDLTEWLRGKMPIVKLVNAIIFVLFAVFVMIWF